jgi:ABC-type branched-subunit amino acid transport system ATPase component
MLLQLHDLAAGYGTKTVISGISLALEPGQILALLGHNGAGKTTTLKAVMGLLPARGRITFDGAPIGRLSVADRVGAGIRLLPEGRGIFPDLNVADNIDVVAAQNVTGPSPMFRPADIFTLFPALAERRTTRAGSMSGGQQQMLALGLAILGSPRCLLLDEPSIGLAPNLVERLFEQFHTICKQHGVGAILVEQNVAAALKIADRIVIMNNGQIVFDGLPDEARKANVWDYF